MLREVADRLSRRHLSLHALLCSSDPAGPGGRSCRRRQAVLVLQHHAVLPRSHPTARPSGAGPSRAVAADFSWLARATRPITDVFRRRIYLHYYKRVVNEDIAVCEHLQQMAHQVDRRSLASARRKSGSPGLKNRCAVFPVSAGRAIEQTPLLGRPFRSAGSQPAPPAFRYRRSSIVASLSSSASWEISHCWSSGSRAFVACRRPTLACGQVKDIEPHRVVVPRPGDAVPTRAW